MTAPLEPAPPSISAKQPAARLTLAELERAVRAVAPAALLVPPRIVRRAIKEERDLPGLGYDVPHAQCYVIPREPLLKIADHADLGVSLEVRLADKVLLLARPDTEDLASRPAEQLLLDIWRLLFHARVDEALQTRCEAGLLGAAVVAERVRQLGATEFEEFRAVLQQEERLLPPAQDLDVYREFAALFLDLLFFDRFLLPYYFPGLEHAERVLEVLAQDFDGRGLFAATRLAGAAEPDTDTEPVESVDLEHEPGDDALEQAAAAAPQVRPSAAKCARLRRRAERARARGNLVGALIHNARAEQCVPPELAEPLASELRADLQGLLGRLQAAIGQPAGTGQPWPEILLALVRQTPRGVWTAEAKLLYDLQKVCDDFERDIYTVDLIEWAWSLGKRPIKRLLPSQRDVTMCKHLRAVARRLAAVHLNDEDRHRLGELIHAAAERTELRLRERFRPVITRSLDEVGLIPQNVPERLARHKLVEELLDQIAERGFLRMGDLRDGLSRNNLKLSDCSHLKDLLGGDQVLRANTSLTIVLDGVYHGAEIYLRWLQHLTSWGFGTRTGRFLTRYVAVPFGGAFLAIGGLEHLFSLIISPFAGSPPAAPPTPIVMLQVFLLGLFLAGLIHVPPFRKTVWRVLKGSFHLAYDAMAGSIRWLRQLPILKLIFASRLFNLGMRFLVKPLALTTILCWLIALNHKAHPQPWTTRTVIFLLLNLLLNSRLGRNMEEVATEWLVEGWQRFGIRFLANLFWWILDVFRWLLQASERVLYTVDEWLRFRSGQGRGTLVAKALLGVLWFGFAYVTRFCINLLIEPQFNPIKHFPVVTVSHKLLVPFIKPFGDMLALTLEKALAYPIATAIIFGIPGIFGFLVWELKENWRLYGANRSPRLKPISIGHHGETLAQLVKPGFRAGKLAKQYGRIRRAAQKARLTGNWRPVRKQLRALHHLDLAIRHFLEREFLALLVESGAFARLPAEASPSADSAPPNSVALPTIERIWLSTNRVRVDFANPSLSPVSLQLEFAVQASWLVAAVTRTGWVDQLPRRQRDTLRIALLGLYKLGTVDLVREQLDAEFAGATEGYHLVNAGVLMRSARASDVEVLYELRQDAPQVPLRVTGLPSRAVPTAERTPLVFGDTPLIWQEWVDVWERLRAGSDAAPDFLPTVQIWPARQTR